MLAEVAELAATDATIMNQQACASSRIQFVEGSVQQVDRYCALLQARLGVERETTSACGKPLPGELREEIEACATWSRTTAYGAATKARAW